MLVVNSFSVRGYYNRNSLKNSNVSFAGAKAGQRLIKNSLHGELSQDLQVLVKKIYSDLQGIKEYTRLNSSNPTKINKAKRAYVEINPDFVYAENAKRITFRDADELISIVNNKSDSKNVRLVVEKQGKETHLLIDNVGRIVSNLNKKYPFMNPPTLRYMTSQEIRAVEAEKYIKLFSEKLSAYKDYLTTPKKVVQKDVTPGKLVSITKLNKEILNSQDNIKNVLSIFDKKAEELPSHLKLSVSPNNGKVLGFAFESSDGYAYKAVKSTIPQYKDSLRYISIKEITNDTVQNICIDLDTKKLLCADRVGKPKIIDDAVYELEGNDKNLANDVLVRMFEKMNNSQSDDVLKEVVVLKNKVQKSIQDIKIEDIEDIEITKLVENEMKSGEIQQETVTNLAKKEPEKINSEKVVLEKVVKKRGRKPKTQENNQIQQVKTLEVVNPSEQLKIALIEFKEAMSREFDVLIEKIGKIVNNK